jgi:hypothetical protein
MSDRVTVERKELEGFLAENQKLLDRSQAFMNRIDQLENENKQLRDELQATKTRHWQASSPPEKRRRHGITALYYGTAVVVVVIGVWYVYATFLAPSAIPPSGLGQPLPQVGDIWSRYRLMITFSVSIFILVLIAGELMLRPRTKGSQSVAAQSEIKTPSKTLETRPMQTQSVILQSEVQPRIQTSRSRPEQSQPLITHPEVQRPSQPKLVYCIYCGNRILASASVCDKCRKAQK